MNTGQRGLFGGMNVHNMSVNMNFGSNPLMDMMTQQMMLQQSHQQSQNLLGEGSTAELKQLPHVGMDAEVMELPYDGQEVEFVDMTDETEVVVGELESKIDFGHIYVDIEYHISVRPGADHLKAIKKLDLPSNDSYAITSIDEKFREGHTPYYDGLFAELQNRESHDFPPILYILDLASITDRKALDQAVYHAGTMAKKQGCNGFFLILEESGEMELGEPLTTRFFDDKGLFRKTSYFVFIKK
jgi:hypothetical protein